jgi:uncharacterized delta-60 repeat protein
VSARNLRPETRSKLIAILESLESRRLLAGVISGVTFQDLDGDNVRDAGEATITGRTVYLDFNGNRVHDGASEPSRTTDAGGAFRFDGLAAGNYDVQHLVPADWKSTTSPSPVKTVSDGVETAVALGSLAAPSTLQLDSSFGSGGKTVYLPFQGYFWSSPRPFRQPDGKVLIALAVASGPPATLHGYTITRFNPDGSKDATFGSGGTISPPINPDRLLVQNDGKIVVAGATNWGVVELYRYLPDGTLDTTFATGGRVTDLFGLTSMQVSDLVAQPDGKLLVAGSLFGPSAGADMRVARLSANGAIDIGFGSNGRRVVTLAGSGEHDSNLAVAPDGKILLAGQRSVGNPDIGYTYSGVISRLTSAGALDTTFSSTGSIITTSVDWWSEVVAQPDGQIVLSSAVNGSFKNRVTVTRLLSTGAPDPNFGTGGSSVLTLNGGYSGSFGGVTESSLAVDSLGRIVIAGQAPDANPVGQSVFVRLLSNGSPDAAFANGGLGRLTVSGGWDRIAGVTASGDGKVTAFVQSHDFRQLTQFRIGPTTVSPVALDSDGTLRVTATLAADDLRIRRVGTDVVVAIGSTTYAYPVASVARVYVFGGGQADVLTVEPTAAIPVTFDGGADGDTVIVQGGATADTVQVNPGSIVCGTATVLHLNVENVTVQSGGGNDVVNYADSPTTAPQTTLDLGAGTDTLIITRGRPLQWLYADGGDGNDVVSYQVQSDPWQNPWLSFNGGLGTDAVTVNGTGGNDTIAVKQSGWDSAGVGGFATTESFVVNAGAGNDVLRVDGLARGVATTVNGGAGDDAFSIGFDDGFTDSHGGEFTLRGDAGADTLVFNDQQETIGWVYTVTPTTLTRTFFPTATYGEIERVTVNAGAGEDWLTVTPAATIAYVINGGPLGSHGFGQTLEVLTAGAAGVGFGAAGGYTFADRQPITFGGVLHLRLTIQGGGVHTFAGNLGSVIAASGADMRLAAEAGATVRLETSQRLAGVAVGAGSSVTVAANSGNALLVGALDVAAGGRLDLGDNDLAIDYAPDTESPLGLWASWTNSYSGVLGMIQRGRAPGEWNGDGIFTSMSDARDGITTLAAREAADAMALDAGQTMLWNGFTVDATTVLVRYTYAGDANLDGQVTGDDYSAIDFGILVAGASGWVNGDFNYDGVVTGDDYSAIDFVILAQGAPL